MNLVVFDIDGTLIKYHRKMNDRAYVNAIKDVFGITIQDNPESWSEYHSSTDSGILQEIIEKNMGRSCTPADIIEFKKSMASWLDREYGREPFESMIGAKECLKKLSNTHGWFTAIATGNWRVSGRYKLKNAGLDCRNMPMASAEDGLSREIIMKIALEESMKKSRVKKFKKIVYVGDWIWDVKAADALGWEFIGIASGKEKKALLEAGAKHILPDFKEMIRLLNKM